MIADLNPLLRGWAGYFGFSQLLDGWTRRRLRCIVWDQWKTRGRRYQELRRLEPEGTMAAEFVKRAAPRPHQQALQGSWAVFLGSDGGCLIRRTAVVRTRMPGGVGGVALRDAPYPDWQRLRASLDHAKAGAGKGSSSRTGKLPQLERCTDTELLVSASIAMWRHSAARGASAADESAIGEV
jgi:hypothetical protein